MKKETYSAIWRAVFLIESGVAFMNWIWSLMALGLTEIIKPDRSANCTFLKTQEWLLSIHRTCSVLNTFQNAQSETASRLWMHNSVHRNQNNHSTNTSPKTRATSIVTCTKFWDTEQTTDKTGTRNSTKSLVYPGVVPTESKASSSLKARNNPSWHLWHLETTGEKGLKAHTGKRLLFKESLHGNFYCYYFSHGRNKELLMWLRKHNLQKKN